VAADDAIAVVPFVRAETTADGAVFGDQRDHWRNVGGAAVER
jgi:hypothetical protein